ncbi:hypothetical protein LEP1GSC051_0171 [Leptospira sp. P2653]|nr:hypothetical protein LEP1GSC051_0171 [Leptospira sp. P2653]
MCAFHIRESVLRDRLKTLKDISKRSGKFLKNVGVPTVRRIDGFSCRLKL